MFQIRIHGRGGQGVVTAAELLSMAAFHDGKCAQAFPFFGSERMGAPVTAYCRIGDAEIRTREPISHPNVVMIQDPTLLWQVEVFSGLSQHGYILINSARSLEDLQIAEFCSTLPEKHCCVLPVSEIAFRYVGKPYVNTGLVAGFSKLTNIVSAEAVEQAIRQKFPDPLRHQNLQIVATVFRQFTTSDLAGPMVLK